jgi:hypothetical protein
MSGGLRRPQLLSEIGLSKGVLISAGRIRGGWAESGKEAEDPDGRISQASGTALSSCSHILAQGVVDLGSEEKVEVLCHIFYGGGVGNVGGRRGW